MSGEQERVHLNGWDQQHEVPPPRDPNRELVTREVADVFGTLVTRNADGVWRDQFGRIYEREADGTILQDGAALEPPKRQYPERRSLTYWQGRSIPPMEWILKDWIPRGQCTLLSGTPGSRKSTFVQQLMIACASGQPYFLGQPLFGRRALGYFCEDPDHVLATRANWQGQHYGCGFGELANLEQRCFVGHQGLELVQFTPMGNMILTSGFNVFLNDVMEVRPDLIVFDIIPPFFGGDENNRRQVHAFISALDGVAQSWNCAILMTAHPSVRGRADGTLTSGSTAWEGAVRARMTSEDPALTGGEKVPSNQRVIRLVKSNYSPVGVEISCTVDNHTFTADNLSGGGERGYLRVLACHAILLKILDVLTTTGRPPSPARAPYVFAKHPLNSPPDAHFTRREFEIAMESMITSDPPRLKIEVVKRHGREQEILSRC